MCCLSSIILYTLQYDYHKLAWRAPKAILAMTEEETASPRPPPASSSDDDPPAASVGGDPKYIVDRTVHATLPPPRLSATPSSIDGVPRSVERLHRLHGTSLLLDASTILRLPPSSYATSCALFHRFYHRRSLTRLDVWSVAVGSILLATKVEEECRPVRSIIATFAHLYRRRRLRYGDDDALDNSSHGDDADCCEADGASSLTRDEKENALRSVRPMPPSGPAYAEWMDAMIRAEGEILVALGFTIQWLPDSHPHRFILYLARVLEIGEGGGGTGEKEKEGAGEGAGAGAGEGGDGDTARVMQAAWNYCNDSCRLDLCVRFEPEVIVS
jgi:hypothetical protein